MTPDPPIRFFPSTPSAHAAHAHLLALFPSQFSSAFLASCVQHHLRVAPSLADNAHELVQRVGDKLLEEGEGARGVRGWVGEDPPASDAEREDETEERQEQQVLEQPKQQPERIEQMEVVRRRWRKGKMRAPSPAVAEEPVPIPTTTTPRPPSKKQEKVRRGRREDVTLARNLALIRLHALFPLVPIYHLRLSLLALDHSFLPTATEQLLAELAKQERDAARLRPRGGGGGVDWAGIGRAALELLQGVFTPTVNEYRASQLREERARRRAEVEAGARAAAGVGSAGGGGAGGGPDPLLTPSDLFHPPAHTAALVAHFAALFPALEEGEVRRRVEDEGGAYAALRAGLEVEVAERAAAQAQAGAGAAGGAAAAQGKRKKRWWNFLVAVAPPPPPLPPPQCEQPQGDAPSAEAHAARIAADAAVQREAHARRVVEESGSRSARDEVEAYYAALRGPAEAGEPALDAGEGGDGEEETAECQCCFADVPARTATRCDADVGAEAHLFCVDCLANLVQSYTTGGVPLPPLSLARLALPCFAASTTPCPGAISTAVLTSSLPPPALRTLEARIAAANLAAIATPASASAPASATSTNPETLHPCPFCPSASFLPLPPSRAAPLSRAFLPAWVEPFPPSLEALGRSVLGALVLLLAVLVLSIGVLVCPGSLEGSRLERVWAERWPEDAPTPASAPPAPPEAAALEPPFDPLDPLDPLNPAAVLAPLARPLPLSLSLQTHLLLAPHRAPLLALLYIRSLAARFLERKEGRRTLFTCPGPGVGAGAGREGRGGGWLERLEGAEEAMRRWLETDEAGEVAGMGGDEVQERRRDKLVQLVWPGGSSSGADGAGGGGGYGCGRVSCLACGGAVNPSAPSLHRCAALPPSSSSSAEEGEGADSEEAARARAGESLRLEVEQAMSKASCITCEGCGVGVEKDGGCNKPN
ncbi:hypothetical protein JCM10207_006964 [Rhodosporidiobolus poonsookiae]